ncbi:thioredoxin family protein [Agromyces ramosus]|uniref:Thiol-disulfide isomerase/thioredoxin n=1 Tax=Agromyces ramosus TaxID=33879 RepID=A0ABU0RC98_9MICO|nr:thioredoxin family protein [Agromyces ramosus]MDQ0895700.1 thiol-disulfide isomerase/thioredoxin [Agromyces ramosus]
MDWPAALIAGVALLAAATAVGLVWKARTGRVRVASGTAAPGPAGTSAAAALDLDADTLGDRATLVQFSTEYCSGCRPTARQLSAVAGDYDGVRHVEIDLTHRADLAARFAVLQTPTTLILGADGALTARIGGVPRAAAVRRHLDTLTGRTHVQH